MAKTTLTLHALPMIKKTLYFGNPTYLSLHLGQLVIKLPEVEKNNFPESFKRESTRQIPIEDIGVVVLDHKQITITQGVLEALTDNNCAVISCDSNHMPKAMLLPLSGNTLQSERFNHQINASLPLKKQLWQQTVSQKIINQAFALRQVSNAETRCMAKWANDVKSGDPMNIEGRAAAYYWKYFFNDKDFIREREGKYPNNLLNYGYAILRAIIARALVSTGVLPTLGIHHHNRYNAFCLADDIMEPYRPFVDIEVHKIVDLYKEDPKLTKDIKVRLLSIPTLDVVISGKKSPLMIAATTTTASLYKCFEGTSRKILYPSFS